MGTGEIIACTCFFLILLAFVIRGIQFWRRRKTGTGEEVDLNTVGRRAPWSGGDIEPDIVTKIEKMLKEETNSDPSEV